jgi:hypothetical protein
MNMQEGGKKYRRQRGIGRQEERNTVDREEYAGRRKEVQETERNMQAGGMRTADREEYAERRKEELETERNMQKGGKQDSRQRGIYRQEEWRARDREEQGGRRNEEQDTGRILQAGVMNTADREEYAGRRKEGQETGRQLKKTRSEPEFVNI